MRSLKAIVFALACLMVATPGIAQQSSGPLRIEITEGVIEPLPIAVPSFIAENAAAQELGGSDIAGHCR